MNLECSLQTESKQQCRVSKGLDDIACLLKLTWVLLNFRHMTTQ